MKLRTFALLALVFLGGCLVSEQEGQAIPQLSASVSNQTPYVGDISFHFRSGLNLFLVVLRFGLMVGLTWLAVRAFRAQVKQRGLIVVLALLAGAATWLFGRGVTTMTSYHIEVSKTRLSISLPFGTGVDTSWDRIYRVEVEGEQETGVRPYGQNSGFTKWETMKVSLVGGETHEFDLERLTFAQRTNLYQAIEYRSGMESRDPDRPGFR